MEAGLLSSFSLVWQDIVFLTDVASAYRESELKPDFGSILRAVPILLTFESSPHLFPSFTCEQELPQLDRTDVLRIVLCRILEDASQLPFFCIKISCVTHTARYPELLEFRGWIPALEAIVEKEGVVGLFRGFTPNMIVGLVERWRGLKEQVARAMDELPVVTRRSRNNLHGAITKQNSKDLSTKHRDNQPSQGAVNIVEKLFTEIILHPLRLVAVRMIVNADLPPTVSTNSALGIPHRIQGPHRKTGPMSNAFTCAYYIVCNEGGFSALFRGFRSGLLLSLVPGAAFLLLGVAQTVAYRQMLGHGSVQGTGASLALLREIVGAQGIWGILFYARLSVAQVLPGFAAFLGAKILVRVCLGKSKYRSREHIRRKELLKKVWRKDPSVPDMSQLSQSLTPRSRP